MQPFLSRALSAYNESLPLVLLQAQGEGHLLVMRLLLPLTLTA